MLTTRTPQSPHRLALLGSMWLACAGQWRLWHTLARLPELADGRAPAFIGSTMVLLAALCTLVFSLLAWPRVIRPALSLALLGTAWAALGVDLPMDMPTPTLSVLLAGGPLAWLWSRPVLHSSDTWTQLLNNLGVAMAAAGVATAVLILSVADFSWMWLQHAELAELLSPVRLWRMLLLVQNVLFLPSPPTA
ncbi:phosphoethanolamine transferase domain-containing protein [Sphaerotilus sp.]|uniref:phosphoethanolamine transferase domain-containing protein n=1 Tax=Sphaerotilus sp. TaxID=2093942 RepID=UPI0025F8837F|nr:phosphoethanolamine transferase domain-containing protein [Sphaerotilus sp.]